MPDSANPHLFDSPVLAHADCPYHRGRAPRPTHVHAERNPACGDWLRLELVMQAADGRIQEAWFDGRGCLVSQAAASILCQAVEGRTLDELRHFTARNMLELLEAPLAPGRIPCGLLAFKVLKTIVYAAESLALPSSSPAESFAGDEAHGA